MAIYKFTSEYITTCNSASGVRIHIEMAQSNIQALHDYGTMSMVDWAFDYGDSTSPVIVTDFPFTNIPELSYNGAPEAGAHGMDNISLECDNLTLTGTTRMMDVIRFEDTDPVQIVHIRVAYQLAGSNDWTYCFTGVIDRNSIKARIDNLSDPDSWVISFTAKDRLELLKECNVGMFIDTNIKHYNYDVKAGTTWYTFLGKAFSPHIGDVTSSVPAHNWPSGFTSAGKYSHHNAQIRLNPGVDPVWISSINGTLFYHSITAIFDAFGYCLKTDAPINNGASWSDMVTTQYCFHDGTNLTPVTIDKLYFIGGLTGNGVYINACSFYDSLQILNHSWYNKNSPYEVLKEMCTSLGLTCKMETTTAGKTYLSIKEVGHYSDSLTAALSGQEYMFSDIEYTPYDNNTSGVKVVSVAGSDITRGAITNKATTIDCYFTSCNYLRSDLNSLVDPGNVALQHTRLEDFYASLWATTDSETGLRSQQPLNSYTTVTNMYSVCAIIPKRNGHTSSVSGTTLDVYAPYECYYQSQYNLTVNGDVVPRFYEGSDTSQVQYYPWNSWIEVPGMALSHLYFSKWAESYDAIGVYRQAAKKMQFKTYGLYSQIKPSQKLVIQINGSERIGYVNTVKLNLQELSTTIEMVII